MELAYSPRELAFRDEVRAFLAAELPAGLAARVKAAQRLDKADMERWHAILNARGWLAGAWPVEHGGPGWSPVERLIFEEECCLAGAPRIVPFGITMLGPVLMRFGSEAQQAHYLPRILSGEDWWCQGYSEPGAGSDLASLRCRAVREGDHYVVNGQKTWTTLGHYASHIFCLVRTGVGGKPQEGISFLLVDLATPGIEMRPIVLLDGAHEVNEVFFSDVRVPAENLVGAENEGWTIAKFLLTHERTNIAGVGFSAAALAHLKAVAATAAENGRPLADDPLFAARMARAEIALEALRTTNLRLLAGRAPGAESSMLKVKGTEIRQELNDLVRRALGPQALPFGCEMTQAYFNNRKLSIFGGSNEIQKQIIARTILGL